MHWVLGTLYYPIPGYDLGSARRSEGLGTRMLSGLLTKKRDLGNQAMAS